MVKLTEKGRKALESALNRATGVVGAVWGRTPPAFYDPDSVADMVCDAFWKIADQEMIVAIVATDLVSWRQRVARASEPAKKGLLALVASEARQQRVPLTPEVLKVIDRALQTFSKTHIIAPRELLDEIS